MNGTDYDASDQGYINANTRSLTIPANELSMSSTLTPIKDNLLEGEETLMWTLQPDNASYTVGADTLAEMTLTDDVAEVNLTLDDGVMDEASQGTGKFTVTRSSNGKLDAPLRVLFSFAGSAVNGTDYDASDQGYINANTRSLTIPANELSMSSTLTPIKDNLLEGEETLMWTLQPDNASYTVGADTLAEMTLTDDVAEVNLTLDDGVMDEASQGTGKFTVTRSSNGKLDAPLRVLFSFAGSAVNGTDYDATDQGYINANTRSLTIPANELSMSSTITPVKDFVIEGDETVTWTLQSDNATYTVGSGILAEMTIADLIDLMFKDSFEDREP